MIDATEDAIEQARSAIASGGALFREGLAEECRVYLAVALRALLQAWLPAMDIDGSLHLAAAERERQARIALDKAGYGRCERLREALAGSDNVTATWPVGPVALDDIDWVWAEVERLYRFTVRHFRSRQRRLRDRVAVGVAITGTCVVAAVFALKLAARPNVRASAVYASDYAASNVVDGLDATEWLLPDQTLGWIEITFSSPRTLHGVRLVNAHNAVYLDRATQRARATAFGESGSETSAEGSFEALKPERSVLDLALRAARVTHVRVEILSFFSTGGGLAEVEVR